MDAQLGPSPGSIKGIRPFLSLREAALLAGVPEAKIRKDIEMKLFVPIRAGKADRLFCCWADVFLLGAVYRSDLLSSALRKKALNRLEALVEPACRREFYRSHDIDALLSSKCTWSPPSRMLINCDRVELDTHIFIDVKSLVEELAPRMTLYATGLSRIEEREGVLGGEAVFRGTRLSVRHIGKMFDGGEPVANIVEDYPYLREDDIQFAHLFYQAHPVVGRPPAKGELRHAGSTAS